MGLINVEIWDATGSKRQLVQVPGDAPVNRFIAVLVERLNLPRNSPDGQVMSYKLHHRGSGRQLLDNSTLEASGVKDGDIMRLQPEITAGAEVVEAGKASPNVSQAAPVKVGAGDLQPPEADHRFSRFELISWWDQARLRRAKVVVVGAGAIGNEVIKNLALLGIGRVFIADLDAVEESNLSRSVLFRSRDRGRGKAEVAAEAAMELYPDMRAKGWRGNITHDLGLGVYRWADCIIGGLDNREARVAINRGAALAGKPWIDGAIERLDGVARVFDAATGPCYECTMSDADWKMLAARRSCALLTREEIHDGKTPTTPTTASVVAGIQCQELVKYLHGIDVLSGQGFVFEGRGHQSYVVTYTRNPECPSHECFDEVRVLPQGAADITARQLLDLAKRELGEDLILEFHRDLLCGIDCSACGSFFPLHASLGTVTKAQAACGKCGVQGAPRLFSVIRGGEPYLDLTLAKLGIPAWDIVGARILRDGVSFGSIGFELGGDASAVLGTRLSEAGGANG